MTGGKPRGGPSSSGDGASFADLAEDMEDLEPLEPGPRPPPARHGSRFRDPAKTGPAAGEAAPAPRDALHFPDPDQPLLGRRSRVRERELTRLRRGNLAFGITIDLHGEDLPSARRRVLDELAAAAEAGHTCVLIVHGKGQHSPRGVARLREALPGWLDDPSLTRAVAACAPAQPRHGGRGAVYVMLG